MIIKRDSTFYLLMCYAVMAVVTFGHAWSTLAVPDEERHIYGAVACSAAWPLYWSVVLWSHR